MRTLYPLSLLLSFQLVFLASSSQVVSSYTIPLKKQFITPTVGLNENNIRQLNNFIAVKPATAILQFTTIPNNSQKETLLLNGIHLLNYLGGNAYVVTIGSVLKKDVLSNVNARTIFLMDDHNKVNSLLENVIADTTVHASIFSFVSADDAISELNEKGFAAKKAYGNYPVIEIRVPAGRLIELANLNFIEYIEPPPPPLIELNYKSTAGTRANVLHTPNYNLNGEGIIFQVNEVTGYPQDHIDFKDRSMGNKVYTTGAYHSTHVHGIIAGAGLINELYKGYAPKASFNTSFEIGQPPIDILTYSADLTNNSYASGGLCSYVSTRANLALPSLIVDRQSIEFRSLIHVMAAGNSGSYQCPVYPLGYNTVYSGYQSAKSTLSVGATFANGVLADFSSKGPGRQGRFKPEIVAPGANIISTTPYNYYGGSNGTSMAAPAVVGGLGLLYQQYIKLYGSKPDNALMKPLLCNSATDLGPAGPDYGYGFGFMNLNRAIQVLDAGNFYKDSVANQKNRTKTISIPQGIAKLKLMLYWQDPPASPLTTKALVNDLDVKVTAPDGTIFLPFVLDTLPSLVTNSARRGIDRINNIEQVVIDNPLPGNYIITVNGYEIGEGDQQSYYVVYDLVPDAVQLTFPANGEVLAPNDNISVQWDSWGDTNSTYKLELTVDNGNNWQVVSSSISGTSFEWTVPSTVTNEARLRITRNNDSKASSPGSFRITGVPAIRLSASQCPGSIAIEWPKVTGASDYEVMWYRAGDMTPVVITTDTSYIFRYLSEDSVYYVTVRARNNQLPGRRAYALSVRPNNGDCKNPIYDHDMKPEDLIYPLVGRAFTMKRLGIETIKMRIKNLDDAASTSSFIVAYSVNGKPWVHEIVNNGISSNSILDYSFQTPFDFSAPGNYNVRLVVSNPEDINHYNDTLLCIVRHIANSPLPLAGGTIDNALFPMTRTYSSNYTGIEGIERFDYENATNSQSLRVGNGIVFDYSNSTAAKNPQSIIATYNLSQFDTLKQSVEMQFNYTQSSSDSFVINSFFIRGNDNAPWISVQDFPPPEGSLYLSKTFKLQLTDFLKSHGQNFSSSFQARWTVSNYLSSILLGNIKLFDKTNDVGVASIDSLLPYNCNLSKAVPIQVTIQNNTNTTFNDVPVKYRINKGTIVSETINSIPPLATMTYAFKQTADLSAVGNYTIQSWIENQKDAYAANDSTVFLIQNQNLITSFPYIEDFERGNGGWLASGTNSSWEYGTPASPLISGAASGVNAWKTNLDGNYNPSENSTLYSACFDFSKLTKPVISISMAMNTDSCLPYCDGMGFSYSVNGKDWRAMPLRSIYNWQQQFTSKYYNRWHVASERLKDTSMIVQLMFAFHSDSYNSFEGIGIDDIHIYDSTTTIYEGTSTEVQANISATQKWTELKKEGKLIAALQPQGQDAGTIQLQTYLHNGPTRNFHGQYYLNRNFVFKPAKSLNDSATIRLYFTDKESDSLLFARNCSNCTLPKNAYRFGISYYKSSDSTELDSSILNNRKGEWDFISNDKLKIVPFMTGYYAEFKVKDAGEFRLSNGGLDGKSDLPVQIKEFSAIKVLSNVDLKWSTAQEINIHHFEVEVAKGNEAFQSEQFEKIGEVISKGRSAVSQSYSFTDNTANKKGVHYYRLKNVDAFGNYSYSKAIPVVFNEELEWQLFPNPSNGKYNLLYQSLPGDEVQCQIFNSFGQKIKEMKFIANGFVQKQQIDLSKNAIANGVYVLQIKTKQKIHVLRLVKQ